MNTTVSKSFGLALLLAVGILAVMVAMGTFSSQKVGADSSGDLHDAVRTIDTGLQLSSRAASAPVEISIEATATADLEYAAPIRVRMKKFGLPSSISASDVLLRGGDNAASAGSVLISGGVIIIEVGDMNGEATANTPDLASNGGTFTIVIRQAAGITNPAIAGVYHVEVDADGNVSTNLDDGGPDTDHVRIDRSRKLSATSGVSGDTVTASGTGYNTDISSIFIESNLDQWGGVGGVSYVWYGGNQGDFTTERENLKGTDDTAADAGVSAPEGFLAAIGVGSVDREQSSFDYTDPVLPVAKPTSNTVYGVVFTNYVVQFFLYTALVEDDASTQDVDEAVAEDISEPLGIGQDSDDEFVGAQPDVGSDGKFSQSITIGEKFSAGANPIFLRDTAGAIEWVGNFTVSPSISLSKDAAQLGEQVAITFNHFTEISPVAVTIGGVVLPSDTIDAISKSDNTKKVTVPNSGLETGVHQIKVDVGREDDKQTGKQNILIGGLPLEFEPASAVPGQQIIIRGKGFSPGASIATIEIGRDRDGDRVMAYDTRANEGDSTPYISLANTDRVSNGTVTTIVINNNGEWTGSIKIPEAVASTGSSVQVRVREGLGNNRSTVRDITIIKPTLTLNPDSGRPGSTLTITGNGFTGRSTVLISYDGEIVTSVNADTTGHFVEQTVVPIDADVGVDEIPVTAAVAEPADVTPAWAPKSATVLHAVPQGVLSAEPQGGPPGSRVVVRGEGFKAYTPFGVTIGGLRVIATIDSNTDGNGDFQETVVVPPLREGIHSIVVTQEGRAGIDNTDTIPFTVGDIGPAVQAVEDAFGDLIDNGSLTTVWRYDFDTRTWTSYTTDPETSFGNDLFEVESGDILYVHVSSDQSFSHQKGETLMMGWSLITLN